MEYILFIRIKIFINRIKLSRRNLFSVFLKICISFATLFV